MAKSTRNQIIDAVVGALEGIKEVDGYQRTVRHVSEELVHWEQLARNKFDAAFPVELAEVDDQFSWYGSGSTTVQSTLEIQVTYYIWAKTKVTREQRGDAIRDVKKAILNDSTIAGLVIDIRPLGSEPVVITDYYSILEIRFEADYLYDPTLGG